MPRVLRRSGAERACSAASPPTAWSSPCSFWIGDPENGQGNVKSEVNLAILAVLNAQGIEIPYPQRVVHAVVSMEKGRDEALPGTRAVELTASRAFVRSGIASAAACALSRPPR